MCSQASEAVWADDRSDRGPLDAKDTLWMPNHRQTVPHRQRGTMIDENPPSAPKRRGPRGIGRAIQIQERDLDILYSLSVGRYLTAPAIEWLHYPGWRERYKAYLERQKKDESLVYRP